MKGLKFSLPLQFRGLTLKVQVRGVADAGGGGGMYTYPGASKQQSNSAGALPSINGGGGGGGGGSHSARRSPNPHPQVCNVQDIPDSLVKRAGTVRRGFRPRRNFTFRRSTTTGTTCRRPISVVDRRAPASAAGRIGRPNTSSEEEAKPKGLVNLPHLKCH